MPNDFVEIPVKVFTKQGNNRFGKLVYTAEGPFIKLSDGSILENNDVSFGINDDSEQSKPELPLGFDDKVILKPKLIRKMGYTRESKVPDSMYPPSTDGWLSNVIISDDESIYTLQEIEGEKKDLLTITSSTDGKTQDAYRIHRYESSILEMDRDLAIYNRMISSDSSDIHIQDILDSNPPSWSLISKLVEGINIPNLRLGKTMGETMEQLVPQSFPESIRKQIMAFLGWLEKAEIPNEDPVDFNTKFRSVQVFRFLVSGHIRCLLENVEPPLYVRTMMLADKGEVKLTQRPLAEQTPWFITRLKLYEEFPDFTGRVIQFAMSLNESNRITTELPVSREDARKSLEAWSNRFAMTSQGLMVRSHVFKEALGLKTLIYVGAAHRWPHKHLQFSARLGFDEEKPSFLQNLVVPQNAVERIIRILPKISPVGYEMNSFNHSLYNSEKRKWIMNYSVLRRSFERSRSLRQLRNEFGTWIGKIPVMLTEEQVTALDLISWGIYLGTSESNYSINPFEVDKDTLNQSLEFLSKRGIIKQQYHPMWDNVRSVFLFAQGSTNRICSVARSFLINTPSAHVMISESGESCFIISRIPEDETFHLITDIVSAASESGISLRALPISAYVGYRNNLYRRLWNSDGSWDADVSGLIDQVRLLPRES